MAGFSKSMLNFKLVILFFSEFAFAEKITSFGLLSISSLQSFVNKSCGSGFVASVWDTIDSFVGVETGTLVFGWVSTVICLVGRLCSAVVDWSDVGQHSVDIGCSDCIGLSCFLLAVDWKMVVGSAACDCLVVFCLFGSLHCFCSLFGAILPLSFLVFLSLDFGCLVVCSLCFLIKND